MLSKLKFFLKTCISTIVIKAKCFFKWITRLDYIEKNISSSRIVKLFTLLIPICGILYLTTFYKYFAVDYFIYFHPLDFLKVFYDNNAQLIKFLSCILFAVPAVAQIYLRSNNYRLHLNFLFSFISSIEVVFVYFILKIVDDNIKPLFFIILFIILAFNFLFIKSKMLSIIIYGYLFILPITTIAIAKNSAYTIEKHQYNFDIILNDNSFLLEESLNNKCKYFIGSLTNYVFIYDCYIKKVRVIPVKYIKEIRFRKNNKLIESNKIDPTE